MINMSSKYPINPHDIDAITLFPLLTDYSVPRSNYFLAEVFFSHPDPLVALGLIKKCFRFFGFGDATQYWHPMAKHSRD